MTIRSNETVIKEAKGAFGRPYYLLAVAEAIVPAGSGTRKENECYRVVSLDRDGTRHGRAFKSYAEAESDFLAYTTPIVEMREGV